MNIIIIYGCNGVLDMGRTEYIPCMTSQSLVQNLCVASVYLLILAVLAVVLATVKVSYYPIKGC